MPDESCRKCGGILADYSICKQCNSAIGMICVSCGTKTMEQFHEPCLYMVPPIQNEITRKPNDYNIQKIITAS